MQVTDRAVVREIYFREGVCAFFQDGAIIVKRQVWKLLAAAFFRKRAHFGLNRSQP